MATQTAMGWLHRGFCCGDDDHDKCSPRLVVMTCILKLSGLHFIFTYLATQDFMRLNKFYCLNNELWLHREMNDRDMFRIHERDVIQGM